MASFNLETFSPKIRDISKVTPLLKSVTTVQFIGNQGSGKSTIGSWLAGVTLTAIAHPQIRRRFIYISENGSPFHISSGIVAGTTEPVIFLPPNEPYSLMDTAGCVARVFQENQEMNIEHLLHLYLRNVIAKEAKTIIPLVVIDFGDLIDRNGKIEVLMDDLVGFYKSSEHPEDIAKSMIVIINKYDGVSFPEVKEILRDIADKKLSGVPQRLLLEMIKHSSIHPFETPEQPGQRDSYDPLRNEILTKIKSSSHTLNGSHIVPSISRNNTFHIQLIHDLIDSILDQFQNKVTSRIIDILIQFVNKKLSEGLGSKDRENILNQLIALNQETSTSVNIENFFQNLRNIGLDISNDLIADAKECQAILSISDLLEEHNLITRHGDYRPSRPVKAWIEVLSLTKTLQNAISDMLDSLGSKGTIQVFSFGKYLQANSEVSSSQLAEIEDTISSRNYRKIIRTDSTQNTHKTSVSGEIAAGVNCKVFSGNAKVSANSENTYSYSFSNTDELEEEHSNSKRTKQQTQSSDVIRAQEDSLIIFEQIANIIKIGEYKDNEGNWKPEFRLDFQASPPLLHVLPISAFAPGPNVLLLGFDALNIPKLNNHVSRITYWNTEILSYSQDRWFAIGSFDRPTILAKVNGKILAYVKMTSHEGIIAVFSNGVVNHENKVHVLITIKHNDMNIEEIECRFNSYGGFTFRDKNHENVELMRVFESTSIIENVELGFMNVNYPVVYGMINGKEYKKVMDHSIVVDLKDRNHQIIFTLSLVLEDVPGLHIYDHLLGKPIWFFNFDEKILNARNLRNNAINRNKIREDNYNKYKELPQILYN